MINEGSKKIPSAHQTDSTKTLYPCNGPMVFKYLALLLTLIIVLFVFQFDIESILSFIKNEETNSLILLFAMLFLPMFFFPMSALLIVAGLKFNIYSSLLISLVVIPLHLSFSYLAVKYLFKDLVEKYANNNHFRIFNIPETRRIEVCFLIMSMPGMPYALKNYLLSVSNVPFKEYMLIGWPIQFLMCLPFILLGDAASNMSFYFLSVCIIIFFLIFVGIRILRKKLSHVTINIKKSDK